MDHSSLATTPPGDPDTGICALFSKVLMNTFHPAVAVGNGVGQEERMLSVCRSDGSGVSHLPF